MTRALLACLLLAGAPKSPDVPAPPDGPWRRLGRPGPEDWLSIFPEPGETFAEYRKKGPVRGTATRRRIYLLPCLTRPPRDPRILERLRDVLAAFYGREVRVLPPAPLPLAAYRPGRRQFRVDRLLRPLREALPPDGLLLLAVTDRDLVAGDLAHVFGWASSSERVGIVSTARILGDPRRLVRRRRLLGLALHEAGHTLSIAHCTFYRCLMNGAHTLEETDGRPLLLCPVCHAKLSWNLGLDPPRRYAAWARALAAQGLEEDALAVREAADATSSRSTD